MDKIYILLLALLIDLSLGDPPSRFHPVGWIGAVISFLERFCPRRGSKAQFLYGTGIVLLVTTLSAASCYLLLSYLKETNFPAYIILGSFLLKSSFSLRGLSIAAEKIERLLEEDKIVEARHQIRALVGRPTSQLGKPLLVSAAIESVAENTPDSFVGPTFYFLIFGVAGAIAYRVVNTFDSMIGYHGRYEYLGKFAARADDALNFIPARLSGVMFVLSALILRSDAPSSFRTMLSDHSRTKSPNAGWTMSAVAGALGVELEKVGHYKLGRAKNKLSPDKIGLALRLMWLVSLIWVLFCLFALGAFHLLK